MAGDSGERKRLQKRPSPGHRQDKPAALPNKEEGTDGGLTITTDRSVKRERRGKENSPGDQTESARSNPEKMEEAGSFASTDGADPGCFFDEDSNQIFPVEQFFGNLEAVQDFSRKAAGTEGMSRREYRRRHYYAKEESDDEQT